MLKTRQKLVFKNEYYSVSEKIRPLCHIYRFILVMVVDSSAKYAKEKTKRTVRAHMHLIHILTKLSSKQTESLHVLKSH